MEIGYVAETHWALVPAYVRCRTCPPGTVVTLREAWADDIATCTVTCNGCGTLLSAWCPLPEEVRR